MTLAPGSQAGRSRQQQWSKRPKASLEDLRFGLSLFELGRRLQLVLAAQRGKLLRVTLDDDDGVVENDDLALAVGRQVDVVVGRVRWSWGALTAPVQH